MESLEDFYLWVGVWEGVAVGDWLCCKIGGVVLSVGRRGRGWAGKKPLLLCTPLPLFPGSQSL